MYFSYNFISATALLSVASAFHVPRAQLEARADVDTAKAILIALQASSFCSSFVPITDVTKTVFPTVPTVTVTGPCMNANQKRQPMTTSSAQLLNTKASSRTTSSPSTTSKATTKSSSTTTSATSTTAKCSIKGVPAAIQLFACDVVKAACLAFVTPKTGTITAPSSTATNVVTPTCTTTSSTTSQCMPQPTTDPRCQAKSGLCCSNSDTCYPCTNAAAVCIYACNIGTDCIYGGLKNSYNAVVGYGNTNGPGLCAGYSGCTGCPSKRATNEFFARDNYNIRSNTTLVRQLPDGSFIVANGA